MGKGWETKRHKLHDFVKRDESYFKKGLDLQREAYKHANLVGDWDVMVKCLENIKTEIKSKALGRNLNKQIETVEKVIMWYQTLRFRYRKKTPKGWVIMPPEDIKIKLSKYLNLAYENLIDCLVKLGQI